MQLVNLPNGTQLNFPDGMAQDEMRDAIQRNFPEYAPRGIINSAISDFKSLYSAPTPTAEDNRNAMYEQRAREPENAGEATDAMGNVSGAINGASTPGGVTDDVARAVTETGRKGIGDTIIEGGLLARAGVTGLAHSAGLMSDDTYESQIDEQGRLADVIKEDQQDRYHPKTILGNVAAGVTKLAPLLVPGVGELYLPLMGAEGAYDKVIDSADSNLGAGTSEVRAVVGAAGNVLLGSIPFTKVATPFANTAGRLAATAAIKGGEMGVAMPALEAADIGIRKAGGDQTADFGEMTQDGHSLSPSGIAANVGTGMVLGGVHGATEFANRNAINPSAVADTGFQLRVDGKPFQDKATAQSFIDANALNGVPVPMFNGNGRVAGYAVGPKTEAQENAVPPVAKTPEQVASDVQAQPTVDAAIDEAKGSVNLTLEQELAAMQARKNDVSDVVAQMRAIRPLAQADEGPMQKALREASERAQAEQQAAPVPIEERLLDPDQVSQQAFAEKAKALGLSDDQINSLAPVEQRDHVTGFYRGETKVPTIRRAQEFSERTGIPTFFVEADIANLGGINKFHNNNAEEANKTYRALSDIFQEEMSRAGTQSISSRHGGDEFNAVVVGATPESLAAAQRRIKQRVAEFVESKGMTDLPHTKAGQPAGVGLHLGYSRIRPGSLDEIFDKASAGVDASKKGTGNVAGSENSTIDEVSRDNGPGGTGEATGSVYGRAGGERQSLGRPSGEAPRRSPEREGPQPGLESPTETVQQTPSPEGVSTSGTAARPEGLPKIIDGRRAESLTTADLHALVGSTDTAATTRHAATIELAWRRSVERNNGATGPRDAELGAQGAQGQGDQQGRGDAPVVVHGSGETAAGGPRDGTAEVSAPSRESGVASGTGAAGKSLTAYSKAQAEFYAKRMSNQGLPSVAVPHPTEAGKFAIVPADEATKNPEQRSTEPVAESHAPVLETDDGGVANTQAGAARDQTVVDVPVTKAKRRPKADTLLQAIVNRGGISRAIMQDVGADPRGRYMPGLFTQGGTTDLEMLSQYLFNEEGFHQLRQDTGIGPGRELEELLARALSGEKVLNTDAMERAQRAEEAADHKSAVQTEAQALGLKGIGGRRTLDVVEAEIAKLVEALAEEGKQARAMVAATKAEFRKQQLLADGMRGLGFSEEEIQEELKREPRTEESNGLGAQEGSQAPDADGRTHGETGAGEGPDTQRDGFQLERQSEEELAAAEQARWDADAKRAAEDHAADNKRQADAERDTFTLTGSDREADVASARGQGGLFESRTPVRSSDAFRNAIDRLLRDHDGEAPAALFNLETGAIDLPYGRAGTPERGYADGYGLAHILAKHPEIDPYALESIVASARKVREKGNTVELETPDHRAVIKLDWAGQKKKWLLTAFEIGPARTAERIGGGGSTESAPLANRAGDPIVEPPSSAGKPQESRQSPNYTGHSIDSIRAALAKVFGRSAIANLESKGLLSIVADAKDLPPGKTISDLGTALFDGERAYLIANRMTPESAKRELLHEIGEHYGLEAMLGEHGYSALKRRVETLNRAGNTRVREAYDFVRELYPEVSEDSPEFFHEVLANIGQDAKIQQQPWWKEVIANVKRWLAQRGYSGLISTADIQDMVLHSLRTVARDDHIADAGEMVPAMASKTGKTTVEFDGTELGGKSQPIAQLVLKARDFARRAFADKTVVATDGSEIMIPWSGIKHTFSGKVSANAAIVASKLDQVIEHGRLISTEPDKGNRNTIKAIHTYETPVSIAGQPVTIHTIVREMHDGKRFYDHFEAGEKAPSGMSGERTGTDSIQPTLGALPDKSGVATVAQDDSNFKPLESRAYDLYGGIEREEEKSRGTIGDSIIRVLQPTEREGARSTSGIIRDLSAERVRQLILAERHLENFAKMFDKMPVQDNYDFINRMEHGQAQPTKELQDASDALRKVLDARRDAVIALGNGKLRDFNESYFPHIWKDKTTFRNIVSRRPLEGGKGFLKQRTYDFFSQGLAAGLDPITTNPVELALIKAKEMDRYIYGQRIFKEMQDKGIAQFVPYEGGKRPDGWEPINDRIAQGFKYIDGKQVAGRYFAPEQAATIINNHLSAGLHGIPVFDMVRKIGNMMNAAQLGLSAFHLGFTTLDASISKAALGVKQISRGDIAEGAGNMLQSINPAQPLMNLYKGDKLLKAYLGDITDPDMAPIVEALVKAGGRVKMDDIYRNQGINEFRQALRKRQWKTVALKTIPRIMDLINKPIFEYLVPRQKLGVFFDMAKDALEKNPAMSLEEKRDVMGKLWDSVDNRMGELVYDNVFWNRALKDALMVSTRSVGWNLGTFREIGGGVADLRRLSQRGENGVTWKGLSDRSAYIAGLVFVTGLLGSTIQYLYTGKGPDDTKDMFFPRTGKTRPDETEDRLSLPTYMKDIAEYYHDGVNFVKYGEDPFHTIENKLHPLISTAQQMITNKDFFGGAIRSPGDKPWQQVLDEIEYLGKQFTPFGIRNYLQQAKLKDEKPSIAGFMTSPQMVGVTPAPGYITKNDAQAESSMVNSMHDSLMTKFKDQMRDGADWGEVRQRAMAAGIKSPQDLAMIQKYATQHPPKHLKAFGG